MSTTNSNARGGTGSSSTGTQPTEGRVGAPAPPSQKPGTSSGAKSSTSNSAKTATAQSGSPKSGGNPKLVRPAPKAKVRRARLLVSKIDPWSVLKLAFLLSVALGIVTVVAAIVLWTVLDLTGIFDQVNSLLRDITGSEGDAFTLQSIASLGQVASFATIIAVVNVVLLTVLSLLASVLYNIAATLVGGIGVTLTDD